MSTRGQHGQDTVQRMIQETEEQKKYELEQQNNTYLNKAIKSVPLTEIRTLNTALKVTNAQVQSSLATAQKTVTELSKSNAAVQTTSASINEANKNLAQVTKASELMKEFAPVMGSLSLATLPATLMNMAKDSIKTGRDHEALVKGMYNGTVNARQAAPSMMHKTAGTVMKTAGIGAAGSFALDMFNGGVMGGTTKTLLGMSSPGMMASGMTGGIGGLGGLVGATGGLAIPAGIALMIGAQMLHSKLGKHLDSKNPLNKQNSLKLATNINYRSISLDPNIQSERMVAKSKIRALGQNGMGLLSQEAELHASLLTDIVANTSLLNNIYDELNNRSEINNKKSNDAINKSALAFGGADQDGLEFNSLSNNGELNSMQRFVLGMSGFNTQVGNLFGALGNFYNFKESNKGSWANRDAYLAGGDPDKAKKIVAKKFNITMAESALLSLNIQNTLSGLDDPESRKLATLIGIFNLNRLSAKKLVEIAKASGAESFIGAQNAADREALKGQENRHNFLIDSILRPLDEAVIQKLPFAKLLSNLGHMSSGIIGGIGSLAGGIANVATGKGTGWWNEMKASYQDDKLSDTTKNEDLLRSEIGLKELDDTALAMAYLARTYPGKFDQLLSKFGIDIKDSHTDKYTGDRITAEEFAERNAKRKYDFEQALGEQNPDESIMGYLKQATLGHFFNKNKEEEIKKRYSHLGSVAEEIDNDSFTAFEGDERGFNFEANFSTLEKMFQEFSRKYDENTSKIWDHNWKIIPGDFDRQKDTNYGKIQTEKEISKAIDTTKSSESNMNLASNKPSNGTMSLNEDMSKQEKLNREEMVALSILKYLPYLENIYENTKKEEEIKKTQQAPDDGKGILDHLGDVFGGFGGGLLKAGGLFLIAKKVLSKMISPERMAKLGSRLRIMSRFGIYGIAAFAIYSIFEEEIDGFLDAVLPDFIKDPFKNFKADWERVKNAWSKGWEKFNWKDLFSWEKLTTSEVKKKREQRLLEESINKNNTDLDLKTAQESLNNLKNETASLEPVLNYVKSQETNKIQQQQASEDLKKYIDSLGNKQEQTVKIFQETIEKSSIATTANIEAIISSTNLNATIGQVVAESFMNNKETYTLDYNIALPFGRNAFGVNVNNYIK